jgi:hypothetical protein
VVLSAALAAASIDVGYICRSLKSFELGLLLLPIDDGKNTPVRPPAAADRGLKFLAISTIVIS